MALDASATLGSPQLAGCKVNPRGSNKTTIARSGVGLGGAIAGAVATKQGAREKEAAAAATTPPFHGIAWLALTESELALVSVENKRGLKLREVLARVPRSDIASVSLGKAAPMISKPLTVQFTGGDHWIVEVPAMSKGGVADIVAAFS